MTATRSLKLGISFAYWAAMRGAAALGGGRNNGTAGGVVLYYHGVPDSRQLPFRRQMKWLKSHTQVVRLSEIRDTAQWSRRAAITFDDGLDSVRRNAIPVLQELMLPATVFVVSGNLGRPPQWEMEPGCPDQAECLMTAEAVQSLPRELIDIGSHTVTHRNLTTLALDELRRELASSRRELERLLAQPIQALSIPYGQYTPQVLQIAWESGYKTVVHCDRMPVGIAARRLGIGRFEVSPDDWMLEFKLKAAGAQAWRQPAQRLKRAWQISAG